MYRAGSGQYQSRGKTYAKRAAVGAGGLAGVMGAVYGTGRGRLLARRGRQFFGTGSKQAKGIRSALKKTAGFRRGVRRLTRPLTRRVAGFRAAGAIGRMIRL